MTRSGESGNSRKLRNGHRRVSKLEFRSKTRHHEEERKGRLAFLEKHYARQDQRAFRDITNAKRYHPKYGQLFQGMSGIELFGLPLAEPDRGSYPDKLENILKARIAMITDQSSEWYSELALGNDTHRQQLIQHMVNEFDNNDIPNLISNDGRFSPITDDLNPHQLLIKYVLPMDKDFTILGYRLPKEFDEKARDGMKIDLASPTDIAKWSKASGQDVKVEFGSALVLVYEVPLRDPGEVSNLTRSAKDQFAFDLDWLTSLLRHFRDAKDQHRKELVRGVAETVAKNVDIYSKVYEQLGSVENSESSVQQRSGSRSGRIFKAWLVDANGCICVGCHRGFCYDQLEVDHVLPWEQVRTTKFGNLQLMCAPCNRLKGNGTMDEFRRKLAEQGGPKNEACCDGNH